MQVNHNASVYFKLQNSVHSFNNILRLYIYLSPYAPCCKIRRNGHRIVGLHNSKIGPIVFGEVQAFFMQRLMPQPNQQTTFLSNTPQINRRALLIMKTLEKGNKAAIVATQGSQVFPFFLSLEPADFHRP